MDKFNHQISILFGIVFCLNGYSFFEEKCHAIKKNTTGKLQCPDDKSIVIKQMGFSNNNCSSDAFVNPRNLSLLNNITCNRSICKLPFNYKRYNFLNIGYQCIECVSVGQRIKYLLKCKSNHVVQIDNVFIRTKPCPAYDIFNVKTIQRDDIKSNISAECIRNQTCEILKNYPINTNIYYHCEAIENTANNDTDRRLNESGHGHYNSNYTSKHDNRNQTSDHVTKTKKNPCSICSTNEQCQTFKNESETYITCIHERRINISMAWVDKSDCNNIDTIARNVVNMTRDVSSLCSGHSNCRISFHPTAAAVGFLNVIYSCNDEHHSSDHINKSSNEKNIGGAFAGGVTILIAFLLIGVFIIRRCRNKNAHESNTKKMNKTRSNPTYDPNELQVDQEINNQRAYSPNSPHDTALYSRDTNYDHLQNKEGKGNMHTDGRDTNYTYKRDFSTYDHIQSKDNMRNQQTKTVETDVYSHLKGGVAVSDDIYDHTLRDGIRDICEGDYDVSHGIMTDDNYDVSENLNRSQVKKSDSLYN